MCNGLGNCIAIGEVYCNREGSLAWEKVTIQWLYCDWGCKASGWKCIAIGKIVLQQGCAVRLELYCNRGGLAGGGLCHDTNFVS